MRVLMLEYHLRRRWEHNERSQQHMERYRSGHNEAVLKTVCPQGRVGSNPTLSARQANKNLQKKVKITLDKTKKDVI